MLQRVASKTVSLEQPSSFSAARRALLAGAGALGLVSCARMPAVDLMMKTVDLMSADTENYPRTAEQIEALPYAQLGLRQGTGGRGILVLSEIVEEEQRWLSSDLALIALRGNRVVRTRGLASDLRGTERHGADLWDRYDPEKGVAPGGDYLRLVTLVPGTPETVLMRSRFEVEGPETIELMGQSIPTLRVREDLDVDVWQWRAQNYWWMSLQGRHAWRSRQHLTRDLPPLELELLKRPA